VVAEREGRRCGGEVKGGGGWGGGGGRKKDAAATVDAQEVVFTLEL
jgi:hypothetical protein